jgi:hypothetical protein
LTALLIFSYSSDIFLFSLSLLVLEYVKEFARLAERFLPVYVTPVAVALLSFCPDLCHETRVEWKVVAAAVEFVTAVLSSPARQGDEKKFKPKI